MPRINVSGVDNATHEGMAEIAQKYELPLARVARLAFREFIENRPDEVPEWVRKEVSYQQLVDENRPEIRVLFFESRVREFLDRALDKPLPPPPSRIESNYVESVKEEIVTQAPSDLQGRFRAFLGEELERYKVLHPEWEPDFEADDRWANYRAYCANHIQAGRVDLAVSYAEHQDAEGRLGTRTAKDLVNQAKREAGDGWQETSLSRDWRQEQ